MCAAKLQFMVFQKFVSEKSEMNYWFIIHDTKEISEKILKFQRCVPSQSPTNHPIHRTLVYQCLRTEKKTGHFKWKFAIYWTISNYDISVCTQFDLEGFEFIMINVGLRTSPWLPLEVFSKCICHRHCLCICLSCCLFVRQVMFPHHSDQIPQRSKYSKIDLWRRSLNVLVIVFVIFFVSVFTFVVIFSLVCSCFLITLLKCFKGQTSQRLLFLWVRSLNAFVIVFVIVFLLVVMFSHHSDQMSQR